MNLGNDSPVRIIQTLRMCAVSGFFCVVNWTGSVLQKVLAKPFPLGAVPSEKEFAFTLCIRMIPIQQVFSDLTLIDVSLF